MSRKHNQKYGLILHPNGELKAKKWILKIREGNPESHSKFGPIGFVTI